MDPPSRQPLDSLDGARVHRVDTPHRELVALTLRAPGEQETLVLWCGGAWGLVRERPRGRTADGDTRLLRQTLENARLVELHHDRDGARAELVFARGPARIRVQITREPPGIQLQVEGEQAPRWSSTKPPRASRSPLAPLELDALREAGQALVPDVLGAEERARRRQIVAALRRRDKALRRRLTAIEADLDRLDRVLPLRRSAELLLASAAHIEPGATVARVPDWHADPPAQVEITIGAGRSAVEEAQARFRRAGKLERGAEIALERLALTEQLRVELAAALESASEPTSDPDVVERAAAAVGASVPTQAAKPGSSPTRSPFHRFVAQTGHAIWVGRSARENDELTLRHTRPFDLWLHARGAAGSHVVVRLERGETCPDAALLDAAHLAAHFSDLRGDARAEVSFVERRHVRKPRGAAPGAVILGQERTRLITFEQARLERLLGR